MAKAVPNATNACGANVGASPMRALALVHRHGKSGLHIGQTHHCDRAQGVAVQEPDAQALTIGGRQGHAHIAIENAGLHIIAQDHDRPTRIPLARLHR